jgi:hypothetical protein
MQLLQSLDIINVLMYLLKLRQIKLLRNMIMPLSTSRLTFIKVRV